LILPATTPPLEIEQIWIIGIDGGADSVSIAGAERLVVRPLRIEADVRVSIDRNDQRL
jgi:hypothetical protein